tara:strand:+ start:707 stop:997 length:291 start_codon:yes stop_codon:yes gene_type:complete
MFRLIALFLTVFLCVVSVAAVYYNEIPILVDFHIFQFDNIPLGIFLFLSMLLGILIASFFLIGLVLNMRKKYRLLKKDHELLDKEVQNLRRIPIQE